MPPNIDRTMPAATRPPPIRAAGGGIVEARVVSAMIILRNDFEQLFYRDPERLCEGKRQTDRRVVTAPFDGDDRLPGDPDLIGQTFLGQAIDGAAVDSNVVSDPLIRRGHIWNV